MSGNREAPTQKTLQHSALAIARLTVNEPDGETVRTYAGGFTAGLLMGMNLQEHFEEFARKLAEDSPHPLSADEVLSFVEMCVVIREVLHHEGGGE